MKYINLSIAKDFSDTPGGRYIKQGPFSGEEFRERLLEPQYLKALKENCKLMINLDGCMGYPSSFLDESFGGLARKYRNNDLQKIIEFKSQDQPGLIDEIKDMLKNNK